MPAAQPVLSTADEDSGGRSSCPLCHAAGGELELRVPFSSIWDGLATKLGLRFSSEVRTRHTPNKTTDLVRCERCGLSYFDPAVPGDGQFWSELARAGGYEAARWDFDRARTYIPPATDVCDIGCGPGAFLELMRSTANRVVGIDHNPVAVETLRSKGIEAHLVDPLSFTSAMVGTFDCVSAFQVIEHLSDVEPLANMARTLLRPGGLLLISVPNRHRFAIEDFEPFDFPPHHISRWTEHQLRFFADRFGFETVTIDRELLRPITVLHVALRRRWRRGRQAALRDPGKERHPRHLRAGHTLLAVFRSPSTST